MTYQLVTRNRQDHDDGDDAQTMKYMLQEHWHDAQKD